ncbi:MAG: CARDB domain-containing protein [Dehalococcoidales bacterium]|nr:CARDB domain-containing protein [Dehalococcoidales bacterium]
MRITRIIASSLSGVLLIIGGCVPLRTVSNEIKPLNEVTPDVTANLTEATVLATFEVSDLHLSTTTYRGEDGIERSTVHVEVLVKNTGTTRGTSKVVLFVDGEQAKSLDTTLAGGASQVRFFEVVYETAGKHTFTIDKLTQDVTIAF